MLHVRLLLTLSLLLALTLAGCGADADDATRVADTAGPNDASNGDRQEVMAGQVVDLAPYMGNQGNAKMDGLSDNTKKYFTGLKSLIGSIQQDPGYAGNSNGLHDKLETYREEAVPELAEHLGGTKLRLEMRFGKAEFVEVDLAANTIKFGLKGERFGEIYEFPISDYVEGNVAAPDMDQGVRR